MTKGALNSVRSALGSVALITLALSSIFFSGSWSEGQTFLLTFNGATTPVTATPTCPPTPTPIPSPTPTAESGTPTATPMPPLPPPLVTSFRMSDTPYGPAVIDFPSGTSIVYIVFDYAQMRDIGVRARIYDRSGNILFEQYKVYTGAGTESIDVSSSGGAFPNSYYATNFYIDESLVKTLIWTVGGPFTPEPTPTSTPAPAGTPTSTPTLPPPTPTPMPPGTKFIYLPLVMKGFIIPPSWRTPVKVSDTPGFSHSPVIATDSGGGIHLVWMGEGESQFNHEIYYRQGDGVNWASTINVSHSLTGSYGPDMAIDIEGKVHVVWAEYVAGVYEIYYSQGDGTSWSEPRNISNTGARSLEPTIAIDSYGHVHVVWAEGSVSGSNEIHYSWRNGTAWSAPLNLSRTPGSSGNPDIAIDATDLVHVVWNDSDDGNWEIYYSRGREAFWSTSVNISHTPGSSYRPRMGIDSRGYIHVVFWEDTFEPPTNDSKVYYIKGDGTAWSLPTILSDPTQSPFDPDMDVDHEDYVHVIWMSWQGVSYTLGNGMAWSQPTSIPPQPLCSAGGTTIAIDRDNNAHAAWTAYYQLCPYSPLYIYYSSTKLAR